MIHIAVKILAKMLSFVAILFYFAILCVVASFKVVSSNISVLQELGN